MGGAQHPGAQARAAAVRALTGPLIRCATELHNRGLSPASSSNYSARLDHEHAVITQSGRDKGALTEHDFMVVDLQGRPATIGQPSAETLLHTLLYRRDPNIGCVLHTHSPRGVVLSQLQRGRRLLLEGWELQKAFSGVDSHESTIRVPIFDNDQDMQRLAVRVNAALDKQDRENQQREKYAHCFGFLLRGHGLYAWGADIATAARHVEAFDYLFGCLLELARRKR